MYVYFLCVLQGYFTLLHYSVSLCVTFETQNLFLTIISKTHGPILSGGAILSLPPLPQCFGQITHFSVYSTSFTQPQVSYPCNLSPLHSSWAFSTFCFQHWIARRQSAVMHLCSSAWAAFPKGEEQSPETGAETIADRNLLWWRWLDGAPSSSEETRYLLINTSLFDMNMALSSADLGPSAQFCPVLITAAPGSLLLTKLCHMIKTGESGQMWGKTSSVFTSTFKLECSLLLLLPPACLSLFPIYSEAEG